MRRGLTRRTLLAGLVAGLMAGRAWGRSNPPNPDEQSAQDLPRQPDTWTKTTTYVYDGTGRLYVPPARNLLPQ